MTQINQLPEFTSANENDRLIIQNTNGVTGQIKKINLISPIEATNFTNPILDTILYRDANWILSNRVNRFVGREGLMWTSFGGENTGNDAQQGKIQIGYLTLKNKLHLLIAGGGQTELNQKFIRFYRRSNNQLLLTLTLGQVLGIDSNNLLHGIIDTSSMNNETVYLEFQDSATAAYGWLAFSPIMFIEA